MTAIPKTSNTSLVMRIGLWSVIAFVINLIWEAGHVRLYTLWATADGVQIITSVLHCSLGDVLIAIGIHSLAALLLQNAHWPLTKPLPGTVIAVFGATAFTSLSEWYNVYQAGNWNYAQSMPLFFDIGVTPLLQWILLPPLLTYLYRLTYLKCFPGDIKTASISGNEFKESGNER